MTDWNNEKQCLEALKIDNQNLEMCLMAVENSKPSENFDEYDIEDYMLPEFRDSKIIKKAILEAKIKTLLKSKQWKLYSLERKIKKY